MTLRDLLSVSRSNIKVLHGGNGRIVAYPLKSDNHARYLDIEPMDVWASVDVSELGFSRPIIPIICCFISTHDYQKANKEKSKE